MRTRSGDRRFPRTVFDEGTEPDVRFSLANERTFLAWSRTALALIAGGVALEALGLDVQGAFRLAASLVLIVYGTTLGVLAWFGWMRAERALRRAEPLPSTLLGASLSIVIAIVGVLVVFGVLLPR
jgi:inner membrane protein YidH